MENKNIYRFEIRTMADGRVNRVMYQENPTVGNFWTLFPGGIYKKCENPKVEETCAAVAAAAARGDEAAKKAAKDTLPAFIFGGTDGGRCYSEKKHPFGAALRGF